VAVKYHGVWLKAMKVQPRLQTFVENIRLVKSFGTFLAIGGAVGLATMFLREMIASLLPADVPVWYGVSVVIAYGIGILVSFFLHGRVTFALELGDLSWPRFWRFVAVAISGALVALTTALCVRYLLLLDLLLGDLAGTTAFAIGALAAAAFNFLLSARLVFRVTPLRAERLAVPGCQACSEKTSRK
jgi:putative flippase GtrA